VNADAVQVGAGVTEAMQASTGKASAVVAEPTRAEPAVGPLPKEPAVAAESQPGSATKPEGRERGRPKKAESEGKTEAKPTAKRQKSLFDF